MNRIVLACAIALGLFGLSIAPTAAQQWPQRTVRFIVPVGASTATDTSARIFAEHLSKKWNQPVIVENRPGAEGLTGVVNFVEMRDDHALLYSFLAPFTVFPLQKAKLPFNPAVDLVPIAPAIDIIAALSISTTLKVNSIRELVAYARANPGKLNYYTGSGVFTIILQGFARSTGLSMTQVPYRQSNLAVTDLAEGRIQVMLSTLTNALPQVQTGKVQLLAITNSKRTPVAPDVPTVLEAGYPALAQESMLGFFGPRGLSDALRDRISADIREVARLPTIAARVAPLGQVVHPGTPQELSAAIEAERAKIAAILGAKASKP